MTMLFPRVKRIPRVEAPQKSVIKTPVSLHTKQVGADGLLFSYLAPTSGVVAQIILVLEAEVPLTLTFRYEQIRAHPVTQERVLKPGLTQGVTQDVYVGRGDRLSIFLTKAEDVEKFHSLDVAFIFVSKEDSEDASAYTDTERRIGASLDSGRSEGEAHNEGQGEEAGTSA